MITGSNFVSSCAQHVTIGYISLDSNIYIIIGLYSNEITIKLSFAIAVTLLFG